MIPQVFGRVWDPPDPKNLLRYPILIGMLITQPLMNYFLQSLDRRKMAQSTGALHHFGYHSEDGILRGSVAPFMHFSTTSDSKQSIGQFSDHIDKYRDVAL